MTGTKQTAPPPTVKKRLGVRTLKTAADVRRQLAKLTRAYLSKEITAEELRTATYALTNLLRAIEQETVEAELQALKESAGISLCD